MPIDRLVVVGASHGGVDALSRLLAKLPADFPAPILVAQHIGRRPSMLPEVLARRTRMPVSHAVDGDLMHAARIYVAPPDHHLLVEGDRLRLSRGPKEHHTRPAIDPLFLSAALAKGPSAIGVILTGQLDDGTAGLQAIKQCGGIAVVQDPREAEAPSMPQSALQHVEVDHCVGLGEMPGLLLALLAAARPARPPWSPAPLRHEHDLSLMKGDAMEHLKALATPSSFVCPDCSGSLWQLKGTHPRRYRCHTGHAFTERSLLHMFSQATDEAMWSAIRSLQEESLLLREMAYTQRQAGDEPGALHLEHTAMVLQQRAQAMREVVESVPAPSTQPPEMPARSAEPGI